MPDDDEAEKQTTGQPCGTDWLSLLFVALLSSALTCLLLLSCSRTPEQSPPALSASLVSLADYSWVASPQPASGASAGGKGTDERVRRHELCRPADPTQAVLDVRCNHTPLPAANISLRTAGLSDSSHAIRAGLLPSEAFDSWPAYLELYVQEVFFDHTRQQYKVAVIALADNHRVEKRFWNSTAYRRLVYLTASQLTLTTHADSSQQEQQTQLPVAFVRDDRAVPADEHRMPGLFWLYFQRQQLTDAAEPLPERLDLVLHHPAMLSSTSTDCVIPSSVNSMASLRFSICEYAYRPVTFSYCSAELRNGAFLPHLRYFLTYHAYLGIHRFVIYDRGFYAELLRPFVEAGLVEYRYWPWPNRNFAAPRLPADWSQVTLISLCSEFQQDISTYYGLFDPDEYLTLPQTELPETALQGAVPVAADFNRSLSSQPFPSHCLAFSYQPAAREPDIRFDLSLVQHARYPLQQCRSMLEQTVSELRRQAQRRMQAERQALLWQLLNQTQSRAEAESGEAKESVTALMRRMVESQNKTQVDLLHMLPILVYNCEETKERAAIRLREEQASQRLYEQQQQQQQQGSVNVSLAPDYFASPPERFTTRQGNYRTMGAHKAFYLTSARLHPWIHPVVVDRAQFVNPNVLRFHHYVSMTRPRWNDEAEVSEKHPHATTTQGPTRPQSSAAASMHAALLSRRHQRLTSPLCLPVCDPLCALCQSLVEDRATLSVMEQLLALNRREQT